MMSATGIAWCEPYFPGIDLCLLGFAAGNPTAIVEMLMAPQAEMAQAAKQVQRETILLVDDDSYIRAFTRMLLERAGYTVLTAPDGEQGLRIFESQRFAIALLLTDLRMPNMSGVELADTILQVESKLPVLIMTGDGETEEQHYELIEKPVMPSLLLRRIAELLKTGNRWKDTTKAAPIAT